MRILVIGGTGFVGQNLVTRLSSCGHQIVVPIRNYKKSRDLRVLPSVSLTESDINDNLILEQLISECEVVVNLVGIINSRRNKWPYNAEFHKYHVELPRRIANACRQHNVTRLLHFSALGANSDGPSMYFRSKGDGEKAACEVFSDWTKGSLDIFKPSIIFGSGDKFTKTISILARWLPFIPVFHPDTLIQPIYIDDVVNFVLKTLDSNLVTTSIHELGGPKIYSLKEFVRLCAVYSGHPRYIYSAPTILEHIPSIISEIFPNLGFISRDNLNSLSVDNVCSSDSPKGENLSFCSFESIAPTYLNKA